MINLIIIPFLYLNFRLNTLCKISSKEILILRSYLIDQVILNMHVRIIQEFYVSAYLTINFLKFNHESILNLRNPTNKLSYDT